MLIATGSFRCLCQYSQMKNRNKKKTQQQSEKSILQSDALTDAQVQSELDEIAATPKRQRIWEVDFLRGLMILFVVFDHFMWDVGWFCPSSKEYNTQLFNWLYKISEAYYGTEGIRVIAQPVFVTMFVFTSGVSCSFSRSNGKRAIKMVAFACLLTAATYALSSIVGDDFTINFNVIHVIALSTLLWTVIEFCWSKCNKDWQKNIFGVVMLAVTLTSIVVGAYANFKPWDSDNRLWYFLAQHVLVKDKTPTDYAQTFIGGDYLPFLPDFGWFLVGAFLGRVIYKEKKSIFPSVNPKFVSPVTFCGRYSLWIYLGSQTVMFGLLYLMSDVFGWL